MDNEKVIKSKGNVNLRKPIILISLSAGVMSYLLPIFSKKLDMNAVEIGGLFSVVSFLLLILKPILGKVADKFGRKPILASSMLIYAIAFGVFSIADSSMLIYIARIFQGFGAALMSIATYAIITDTTEENHTSEGFGKLNSSKATGYIYGFIITVIILSKMRFVEGWKIIFGVFLVAAIIAFFIVIKDIPETKVDSIIHKKKVNKVSKEAKKILIITFLTSFSASMVSPMLMIYLQDKFTSNIGALALAFVPSMLVQSLLSRRVGKFSDKNGKRKSMIIGLIISGVVIICIPNVNSIALLAVLWCTDTLGDLLYGPSEEALYSAVTNQHSRGEMYGVYSSVGSCGVILGPIIGGLLYDNVSQTMPFYLNGVVTLIAAFLVVILVKRNTVIKTTSSMSSEE